MNVGNFYIFPTELVRPSVNIACWFLTSLRRGEACQAVAGDVSDDIKQLQALRLLPSAAVDRQPGRCMLYDPISRYHSESANALPDILFLRTFALYGRDWRVGGSIFGFAMILLGISCVRDGPLLSYLGTYGLIVDISGPL